ncbi:DUF2971 domain-containing protein [Acinetobacter sp. NCu2D-2]|uniref:DUF2971 domain-containing protein n=1 Tax=Acinetobacter sp. NCu2D-2 TaxID=1608473 RepID=UPI0012FF3BE8|nr:DUF2971 domain-containing protein [Acinetobacter sp. NCu2D-2]
MQEDYFYAPHPSKLNDPCENLFIEDDLNKFCSLFSMEKGTTNNEFKQAFYQLLKNIRENVGIYSLSKNVLDELLWAYYADAHTGFCIEYDWNQLKRSIRSSGEFDVVYQDDVPKCSLDILLSNKNESLIETLKVTSGTKSNAWKHEDEFRLVMDNFGKIEYDFRAVKAIYFGLRMPETNQEVSKNNESLSSSLKKVTQKDVMFALRGRRIKYYKIRLKPNTYKFEMVEIEDLFKDAPRYKYSQKFVDKG